MSREKSADVINHAQKVVHAIDFDSSMIDLTACKVCISHNLRVHCYWTVKWSKTLKCPKWAKWGHVIGQLLNSWWQLCYQTNLSVIYIKLTVSTVSLVFIAQSVLSELSSKVSAKCAFFYSKIGLVGRACPTGHSCPRNGTFQRSITLLIFMVRQWNFAPATTVAQGICTQKGFVTSRLVAKQQLV